MVGKSSRAERNYREDRARDDARPQDDDEDEREDRDDDDRRAANDDKHDKDEDGDDKEKKPSIFQNIWVRIGIVVAVVVLLIGGLLYWLHARQYEDTDDAFIDTHIVHVAPQIAGQVTSVPVNDNQLVHRGQLLAVIDSANARAQLAQIDAQIAQAQAQISQAQASEAGAAAQAIAAERTAARYTQLLRLHAIAPQQVDQAVATGRQAVAQRDAAHAQIVSAQEQIKALSAQRRQTALNLGYTRIVAPVDGHVTQRSVAVGNYVSPGQEIMTIVPTALWVTANFKETQLALVHVGQSAEVDVDSCGQPVWGRVQSIQRGAGQAFGLLPPENATGNYVKVVQRVPVKIVLAKLPKDCILGPGMSVEPTVKVR